MKDINYKLSSKIKRSSKIFLRMIDSMKTHITTQNTINQDLEIELNEQGNELKLANQMIKELKTVCSKGNFTNEKGGKFWYILWGKDK